MLQRFFVLSTPRDSTVAIVTPSVVLHNPALPMNLMIRRRLDWGVCAEFLGGDAQHRLLRSQDLPSIQVKRFFYGSYFVKLEQH